MKLSLIDEIIGSVRDGEDCTVYGRISKVRRHKGTIFFDILDHTGKLQIVADRNKYDAAELDKISPGSYVCITGRMAYNRGGRPEINSSYLDVVAPATLPLTPTPWSIDGTDPAHGNQIFSYPGFYVANPQRAAVLRVETNFVTALHEYLLRNRFTRVEPPVLTDKTLYGSDNAVRATVHGEDVFLTQCATFELEPLAMVFGKVYTISPAFRNEKSGSKRHLAEYTHVKAEMLLADMEDLMHFSGDLLFNALKSTAERSEKELRLLGVEIDPEPIRPENHVRMTYNDAIGIVHAKGSSTEYGRGLTHRDEQILTKHVGERYIWVQFPPFASEGFPYKRKPGERHLSMTCDLIAPHGSGEMVGVAEKTTDAEELVENLVEKGMKDHIRDYWQYILLRHYGLPQHGGIGAAPERIIYGLLGLDHIRLTKPWPRYPDRRINSPTDEPLMTWGDPELERLIKKYDLNE